jgi:hypothetical protein
MAEQLLSRRPENNRTTRKVEPIPLHAPPSRWYQRILLLLVIAVGGALVGHLGSQLTSRLLSDRTVAQPALPHGGVSAALSEAATVSDRLLEIDQHMGNRDFGTALLLCDEALAFFPGDSQLQGRRQHAEDELHNRFRYQMFEQAAARRNYAAALALFNEIPADSLYKFRATQELPSVRSHLVGERLTAAQTAVKLGQCNEARVYAEGVLALDSSSSSARAVLAQCPAPQAAAPAGGAHIDSP